MGILKIVEESLKRATSSKDILSQVQAKFPINEFTIEAEQYQEFTTLLIKEGRPDLIKNVFPSSGPLQDKERADWETIESLTRLFAGTPEVKQDKDLQKVYIRLAALAKGISGQDKSIARKLEGRSQTINKVYGLLTNSQALKRLLDSNVSVKGEINETASSKSATVNIKYEQNVSVGTRALLGIISRFTSKNLSAKLEEEVLDSFINIDFSKIGKPELTERFFNDAVKQLDAKLASSIPEFNALRKFSSTKLAILKGSTKAAISRASVEAKKLKGAIDLVKRKKDLEFAQSPASLLAIINKAMHSAIQGNGVFPGTMKPSGAPSSPDYLRYQTGRFARSAEAMSASVSDGNLNVLYNYLRDPYESLYTSNGKYAGSGDGRWWSFRGRDVEYIIEQAITDIAKELISSNLQVKATPI